MRYEANDEDVRRERAYDGFGTRTPRCSTPGCTESDWRLITGSEPDKLLCYEHAAEAAGRSPVEEQHPPGRANDPTFTVPFLGNLHRVMDEAKRDWPERTMRNPDGSPMLKAAACVRAERAVSRALSGSCQLPLGAYAQNEGDQLRLRGFVARRDGSQILSEELTGSAADPEALGDELARRLRAQGATEILASLTP